jgi:uncharacterized protein
LRPADQQRFLLDGPAGALEVVVNDPGAEEAAARSGIALIAHPHPLYGGSLDNKVVTTLAKTFFALGYVAVRMNFRGVGASQGAHDQGAGETEDWLVVWRAMRERFGELPVLLAGFSFGAFVQSRVGRRLAQQGTPAQRLVLVAPAAGRFQLEPVPDDTLVIHGEEDDVVPLADVLSWVRPQQLPVLVVPGTGHFFHGSLPVIQRAIQRFCCGIGQVGR